MKAEYVQIVDGHEYQPGEEIWDLGSWVAVDSLPGLRRRYVGLSGDVAKLPHYVSSGSTALCLDTGDWYIYLKSTDMWYKPWATSAFAASKGTIENADYTVDSTDLADESAVKAKVVELISALESGITVTEDDVTVISFVKAIDGDADNVNGINGSYSCLVAIKDETAGTSMASIHGVITAKKYEGTPNVEAVANAKKLIAEGEYTLTQKEAGTWNALVEALVKKINALEGMDATEITITSGDINMYYYSPALAGDADEATGVNGSFDVNVKIVKGQAQDKVVITGVITATAYDGQTNADAVKAAKTAIEAGEYIIDQVNANSASMVVAVLPSKINAVEGLADTGIKVTSSDVKVTDFTPAVAGDIDEPNGTNGSFKFTVKFSKGKSAGITKELTGTVKANAYVGQSNPDAVAAAKSAIEGGTYTVTQASANTEVKVKASVVKAINALDGMSETGIAVTESDVTISGFKAAVAGDADTPKGTNGSFGFTVKLVKGKASDTATKEANEITATAFSGTSNADTIKKVKEAIEAGTYTLEQASANDEAAVKKAVLAKVNAIEGVSTAELEEITEDSITISEFKAAVAGTDEAATGTNGSFTFAVALKKGKTTGTATKAGNEITATAYSAPTA